MRVAAFLLGLCWAGLALGQQENVVPPGMVDEDEDLLPQTEYVFNPIQANKDLKVGKFYAKKGNHRAAAARFLEATRWNPNFAEAYWRLAEAREKLDQLTEAADAYRGYLRVDPDGSDADKARKRLEEIEAQQESLPLAAEDAESGP